MIPQQAIDNLFDRFYRVEESRSQATGGTGLGLAIAQSIGFARRIHLCKIR